MTFKEELEKKLCSSKFRLINEKIYTKNTVNLSKRAMEEYHRGYEEQLKKWPVDPLDVIVERIKQIKNDNIADIGCGGGRLMERLSGYVVHSFDLYPINKKIIKCDMKKIPLEDNSVDVVVYCLSLMKNNVFEIIKEGNRILSDGGRMIIAEVKSRVKNFKSFIHAIEKVGFKHQDNEFRNSHFIVCEFIKVESCKLKKHMIKLEPCKFIKR
ncbi:Ribosomal RNA-processing protein 8 [Astathelohania contejeani]|uniref:Ribosomal RNA-processing protein 8 n=1 Tax=Astathelohania contejeani TaxID=164912 RepID=A0ABQ7HW35_9MICR|nr:Ribosomal RNA-processing protein 8 [Thelohania contejeani]